jgi:hypothetical protein
VWCSGVHVVLGQGAGGGSGTSGSSSSSSRGGSRDGVKSCIWGGVGGWEQGTQGSCDVTPGVGPSYLHDLQPGAPPLTHCCCCCSTPSPSHPPNPLQVQERPLRCHRRRPVLPVNRQRAAALRRGRRRAACCELPAGRPRLLSHLPALPVRHCLQQLPVTGHGGAVLPHHLWVCQGRRRGGSQPGTAPQQGPRAALQQWGRQIQAGVEGARSRDWAPGQTAHRRVDHTGDRARGDGERLGCQHAAWSVRLLRRRLRLRLLWLLLLLPLFPPLSPLFASSNPVLSLLLQLSE